MNTDFVSVETSCGKYEVFFSSKSQLHKHLKNGSISSLQPLLPGALAPILSIFIITLRSMVPVIGSGLAFWDWIYTTTAVTFVPRVLPLESDFSATACLDIGYGVTLVDKDWLLRQLFDQKIKDISTSLKVRKIGASKHESAQFVELFFFFLGEDNEEQNVCASIRCKLI